MKVNISISFILILSVLFTFIRQVDAVGQGQSCSNHLSCEVGLVCVPWGDSGKACDRWECFDDSTCQNMYGVDTYCKLDVRPPSSQHLGGFCTAKRAAAAPVETPAQRAAREERERAAQIEAERIARVNFVSGQLAQMKQNINNSGLEISPEITNIPEESAKSFGDLSLQKNELARLQFSQPINLLDESFINFTSQLSDLLKISHGRIELNIDETHIMNKPAIVSFFNVNLYGDNIEILRNSEDSTDYVTNLSYDTDSKVLTFEVAGFSTYELGTGYVSTYSSDTIKSSSKNFQFIGSVSDLDSTISATFNEGNEIADIIVREDGTFEFELELDIENENTLNLLIKGSSGVEEEKTYAIVFEKTLSYYLEIFLIPGLILIGIVFVISLVTIILIKRRKKSQVEKVE